MSLTKPYNTGDLAIIISENRGISSDLNPGETIIGRVVRESPIQDDNATLTIRFRGRARTNLLHPCQRFDRRSRSEVDLLGDEHVQTLHQGAIEIKGGSMFTWRFSFDIPSGVGGRGISKLLKQEVLKQDDLFVRVTETKSLPPSFYTEKRGWQLLNLKSFVEYWFVAVLETSDGRKTRAVLPVTIGHKRETLLSDDMRGQMQLLETCVALNMHSLQVGDYRPRPSLSRPIDRLLGFRKRPRRRGIGFVCQPQIARIWALNFRPVPIFVFNVEAWVPRVLQAGNINQIPFLLGIFGNEILWKGSSQEETYDFDSCYIDELTLSVDQATNMKSQGVNKQKFEGGYRGLRYDAGHIQEQVFYRYKHSDYKEGEAPLQFEGSGIWLRIPELLRIPLPVLPDISPTFKTFNIKAEHCFNLRFTLSVNGVKIGFCGRKQLELRGLPVPAQIVAEPVSGNQDPLEQEDQSDGDQSFDGDDHGLDDFYDREWAAFVQESRAHEDDEIFAP